LGNFSEYIKNSKVKSSENNSNNDKIKNENARYEDLINKYSEYSNDKLLSEFINLTMQRKRQGNLSDTELNNIKNMLLPYLNNEQKINLEKLIDMVKNV